MQCRLPPLCKNQLELAAALHVCTERTWWHHVLYQHGRGTAAHQGTVVSLSIYGAQVLTVQQVCFFISFEISISLSLYIFIYRSFFSYHLNGMFCVCLFDWLNIYICVWSKLGKNLQIFHFLLFGGFSCVNSGGFWCMNSGGFWCEFWCDDVLSSQFSSCMRRRRPNYGSCAGSSRQKITLLHTNEQTLENQGWFGNQYRHPVGRAGRRGDNDGGNCSG